MRRPALALPVPSVTRSLLASLLAVLIVACAEPPGPATRPQPGPQRPADPAADDPRRARRGPPQGRLSSDDDLAAEKALAREQGGRQYVSRAPQRLPRPGQGPAPQRRRHRPSAKRWAHARDPQRSYRRWREARHRIVADLSQRYRELRREGVDAGSTQALVERIYRQWEDVKNDLGGDVGRAGALRRPDLRAARASLEAAELTRSTRSSTTRTSRGRERLPKGRRCPTAALPVRGPGRSSRAFPRFQRLLAPQSR
jgi:hypothetical protein